MGSYQAGKRRDGTNARRVGVRVLNRHAVVDFMRGPAHSPLKHFCPGYEPLWLTKGVHSPFDIILDVIVSKQSFSSVTAWNCRVTRKTASLCIR
jgi:hypothetical protein